MPRPMAVIGITFFFTLALLCDIGTRAAFICACAAAAGFALCLFLPKIRQNGVLPAACITIAAASVFFAVRYYYDYLPAVRLAGENKTVVGTLADLPYTDDGKYRYVLKCDTIGGVETNGLKLLLSSKKRLNANPCDKISFMGTVYQAGGHGEEAQSYYRSQSLYLGGYTMNTITVERVAKKPLMYYILAARSYITDTINSNLPTEEGGVVTAMLIGSKAYMSNDTLKAFNDSGVLHLFSVSGFHMTLWALSVLYILEKMRLNRRLAAALASAFTLFFIALTGFSAPCVRAGIMMLIILAGRILSRDADAVNSLGLAVLVICLINPFVAGYAGLQLSFLSTLGLLLLAPVIYRGVMKKLPTNGKSVKAAFSFCALSVSVSLSVLLVALPVLIITFGQVPLIAPVTNLLTVYPATLCILCGGLIPVFTSVGVGFLSKMAALVSGLCAKYLIFITRFLAGLPYSHVGAGDKYIFIWLALTMIFVAAAVIMSRLNRRAMRFTASLSAVTLLVGIVSFEAFNLNLTEITVVNTGGGSAVLVSKEGNAALFGCGGDYFASGNIAETLDKTDADELSLLLLPRPEETEMNAAESLLTAINVREIIAPERSDKFSAIDFNFGIDYIDRFSYEIWLGFTATYFYTGTANAVYLEVDGTTALIMFYPGCDVSALPAKWLNADILICRAMPPKGLDASRYGITVISSSGEKSEKAADFVNADGGRAYTTAAGNVTIKTRGDSVCTVV